MLEFLALSKIFAGVTNLAPQRGAEHLDRLMSSTWALRVIVPLGEGLMPDRLPQELPS